MSRSIPARLGVNHPSLKKRHGANLPHWRIDGGVYSVTFRLADSLPAEVLQQWKSERIEIESRAAAMGRQLTIFEKRQLDELHSQRIQDWLDKGHGSCAFRDPQIAELVANAIQFFDGDRYELFAWCVMPNHAHAVLSTRPEYDLSRILQSWKGFSGNKAMKLLNEKMQGAFWQKESYDHLVRDQADFEHQVRYALQNPLKAGLADWKWVSQGGE